MAETQARIAITATDKTRAAFDSAKRNLAEIQATTAAVGTSFAGLATVVASALAAFSLRDALQVLDDLDDLAEKSGVATRELSGLRFAGEATGTSTEALGTGMRKLSQQLAAAAGGSREAVNLFEALGIKVRDANGSLKSADTVLFELADRFVGYRDGVEKSALAQEIFGKSGAEMIPLLNQGAAGIRRLQTEAEALGAVYGGELAKQAADFNDSLKKLSLASEGAKVRLLEGLLKPLNATAEAFLRNSQNASLFSAVLRTLGEGLSQRAGNDELSQLQARAKREATALELQAKSVERFTLLAQQGIKGAAELAADARSRFDQLSAAAAATTAKLKGAADLLDPPDYADAQSRRLARGGGRSKPAAPIVPKGPPAPQEKPFAPFVGPLQSEGALAAVKALDDNAVTNARNFAESLALLDSLFFDLGIDGATYDAAIAKITKSTSSATKVSSDFLEEQRAIDDLIRSSSIGALEKQREQMLLLAKAYEEGRFGIVGTAEAMKTYSTIAQDVLGNIKETRPLIEDLGDAFRTSFATAIESGKGLRGVLDSLLHQLQSFALNQIGKELFASASPVLGNILGAVFGGRAMGGPVTANQPVVVGERGPEWFVPAQSGQIVPAGAGGSITITDQRTIVIGDVASRAEVASMLQRSNRALVASIQRSQSRAGALAA